jgi:hypothetical protein
VWCAQPPARAAHALCVWRWEQPGSIPEAPQRCHARTVLHAACLCSSLLPASPVFSNRAGVGRGTRAAPCFNARARPRTAPHGRPGLCGARRGGGAQCVSGVRCELCFTLLSRAGEVGMGPPVCMLPGRGWAPGGGQWMQWRGHKAPHSLLHPCGAAGTLGRCALWPTLAWCWRPCWCVWAGEVHTGALGGGRKVGQGRWMVLSGGQGHGRRGGRGAVSCAPGFGEQQQSSGVTVCCPVHATCLKHCFWPCCLCHAGPEQGCSTRCLWWCGGREVCWHH